MCLLHIQLKLKMKNLVILTLMVLFVFASAERVRMLQTGWAQKHKHHSSDKCKNWDQKTEQCIECYEGCTKWQNICLRIVKYCEQWNDQGDCTKCQKGYGDMEQNSINETCPQYEENIGQNNGNQTYNQTQEIDPNCQCHNDEKLCIYCYAGYYLDIQNTCIELPEKCTAADPLGQCTACQAGFEVKTGECVSQECDLSLCGSFNEDRTKCESCPLRSYLLGGCCWQVNGYCKEYVQKTGECTKCYVGYALNRNNDKECVPEQ